jgi:hypothetical protein
MQAPRGSDVSSGAPGFDRIELNVHDDPKPLRQATGDDLVRRASCVLRAVQCKMIANLKSSCFLGR